MNIKINKKQAAYLNDNAICEYVFGSQLYGTAGPDSDVDKMVIYKEDAIRFLDYLPNIHQFQYDDEESNTQYIYSTKRQFLRNAVSGDSTINVEIALMVDDFMGMDLDIQFFRTYKVLKAFLGFAKRDLRDYESKNKAFHVQRGIYMVKKLLEGKRPNIKDIQKLKITPVFKQIAENEVKLLRTQINDMYNQSELSSYRLHALDVMSFSNNEDLGLSVLMAMSNNIKEFKY